VFCWVIEGKMTAFAHNWRAPDNFGLKIKLYDINDDRPVPGPASYNVKILKHQELLKNS